MNRSNCIVKPMKFSDLGMVLAWRNEPDVRRYMFTQHEISLEEHTNWFEKVSNNPLYHLLVFEKDKKPCGFVSFRKITDGSIYEWGFYLAPNSEKGTGQLLGRTALDYAFQKNNFHKVCGQALAYNQPSINFHKKLGFMQEGIFREQYYDGKQYHDIVHFGLLAEEWKRKGL